VTRQTLSAQAYGANPTSWQQRTSRAGFALGELLIAMTLGALVIGTAFALLRPLHLALRTQPEAADTHQRLRVGLAAIADDLRQAGAGSRASPDSWFRAVPAVLPVRLGTNGQDPPLSAFTDRVTILRVASEGAVTSLSSAPSTGGLLINQDPGCPVASASCGFTADDRALLFDLTGAFHPFAVAGAGPLWIDAGGIPFAASFAPATGAGVAEIQQSTYYLDRSARQLRRYDGHRSDLPVLDDVADFEVRLFGTATPPAEPASRPGIGGCLADAAGGLRLGALTPTDGDLVDLTAALLTDGPICGQGPLLYDADLLRVIAVRVRLRVEATSDRLRRRAGGPFERAGTASEGGGDVHDFELTVEVAPRNLPAGR